MIPSELEGLPQEIACFVVGLHLMNSPATARRGNQVSTAGMAIAIIVTLVLLGEVMQLKAMGRTSQAIRQLLALAPSTALRIEHGSEQEVPLSEIRVGDRLRVRPGEKIPLDGAVLGCPIVTLARLIAPPFEPYARRRVGPVFALN